MSESVGGYGSSMRSPGNPAPAMPKGEKGKTVSLKKPPYSPTTKLKQPGSNSKVSRPGSAAKVKKGGKFNPKKGY